MRLIFLVSSLATRLRKTEKSRPAKKFPVSRKFLCFFPPKWKVTNSNIKEITVVGHCSTAWGGKSNKTKGPLFVRFQTLSSGNSACHIFHPYPNQLWGFSLLRRHVQVVTVLEHARHVRMDHGQLFRPGQWLLSRVCESLAKGGGEQPAVVSTQIAKFCSFFENISWPRNFQPRDARPLKTVGNRAQRLPPTNFLPPGRWLNSFAALDLE